MNRYILLFFVLVLLAGCRSSKQISQDNLSGTVKHEMVGSSKKNKARKAEMEIIRHLAENRLDYEGLTANARVKLTGVGKDLGVNGKLFMRRDEVVRLSLRFLGMELGVLEFTPDKVLVVDRMHKQYVRVGYADVNFLQQAQLDFNAVQALFWNELFVPGEKDATRHLERFSFAKVEGSGVLNIHNTKKLNYTFYTPADGERIEKLLVRSADEGKTSNLIWKYDQFEEVGNRLFPLYMTMQTQHKNHQIGLHLELSGLRKGADGPVQTKVSSRYTQRTVEEVLKGLK